MKDDCISRQATIDTVCNACSCEEHLSCPDRSPSSLFCDYMNAIRKLPSAQHEITEEEVAEYVSKNGFVVVPGEYLEQLEKETSQQSRLENAIHGKSPEEIYEFIIWLFFRYAKQFTDSRLAIIDWLKGESDG